MFHILDLLTKLCTVMSNISGKIFRFYLGLPDYWFEEVVDNFDKVSWMNNKTGFQVLLIPSIYNLQKIQI